MTLKLTLNFDWLFEVDHMVAENALFSLAILIMYIVGTRSKVWKFQSMGLNLPTVKIALLLGKLFAFCKAPYKYITKK